MKSNTPNTETAEMVEPEVFVVHLRTMPGDSRPGVTRLRQLLKLARRSMRLQCVRLSQADGEINDASTTEETTP